MPSGLRAGAAQHRSPGKRRSLQATGTVQGLGFRGLGFRGLFRVGFAELTKGVFSLRLHVSL